MSDRSLNDLERYLREECMCEMGHQCESCNWLQDLTTLRAENERLREMVKEAWRVGSELQSERDALRAQPEATERDAERLDWLEQYQPTADHDGEMLIALVGSWTFNRVRHNEGLRAAIDAARDGAADAE